MQPVEGNYGIDTGNLEKTQLSEDIKERQPTMSYIATALDCWPLLITVKNGKFKKRTRQK
jgi:hypothetical protein